MSGPGRAQIAVTFSSHVSIYCAGPKARRQLEPLERLGSAARTAVHCSKTPPSRA